MLLTATLLATGGVELAVDGTRWLSSEVAAIRRGDDTWAATDCAFVNGTCAPLGAPAPRQRTGRDAVGGAYASEELAYEVDGNTWTTGARAYAAAPDAVVLSQRFDGNWTWPGSGAADDVAKAADLFGVADGAAAASTVEPSSRSSLFFSEITASASLGTPIDAAAPADPAPAANTATVVPVSEAV